jgi:hypothetical protein
LSGTEYPFSTNSLRNHSVIKSHGYHVEFLRPTVFDPADRRPPVDITTPISL